MSVDQQAADYSLVVGALPNTPTIVSIPSLCVLLSICLHLYSVILFHVSVLSRVPSLFRRRFCCRGGSVDSKIKMTSPREISAVHSKFEITFQNPFASSQTLESTWESCVALPKLEQRLREPWNSFLHNAKVLNVCTEHRASSRNSYYNVWPYFQTMEDRFQILTTRPHRVVFALIIINKAGGLVYQRDFNQGLQNVNTNDYLVLAGTFHGCVLPLAGLGKWSSSLTNIVYMPLQSR